MNVFLNILLATAPSLLCWAQSPPGTGGQACYSTCPGPANAFVPGEPPKCWFCSSRQDCVDSGGCDADDSTCGCNSWSMNYCGTCGGCNEYTKCINESKDYNLIKGTAPQSGSEWCWEVDSGNSAQEGDKIELAECDESNENQLFEKNPFTNTDGINYISLAPKVEESYLVGIREDPNTGDYDGRSWLRIEPPTAIMDGTQFYFLDEDAGFVYTGASEEYIVTTFGVTPKRGAPVMLQSRTSASTSDKITSWTLVPV